MSAPMLGLRMAEATAVSTCVNSVQYDDPACLDEAEPETQASLL